MMKNILGIMGGRMLELPLRLNYYTGGYLIYGKLLAIGRSR